MGVTAEVSWKNPALVQAAHFFRPGNNFLIVHLQVHQAGGRGEGQRDHGVGRGGGGCFLLACGQVLPGWPGPWLSRPCCLTGTPCSPASLPPSLQFNITKLQLIEAEKQKLKREYERRENAVEVKKKVCMHACVPQVRLGIVCTAAFVGVARGSLGDTYINASVYVVVSPTTTGVPPSSPHTHWCAPLLPPHPLVCPPPPPTPTGVPPSSPNTHWCPPPIPPQVEFSKQLNESRIKVLQAREDALQELLAEAYSQVRRPPPAHKLAPFEEAPWGKEEVPWREEEVLCRKEQMWSSPMAWHL